MYCYENSVSAKNIEFSQTPSAMWSRIFHLSTNVKMRIHCPNVGSDLWPKYVLTLDRSTLVKAFLYNVACYSSAPYINYVSLI